MAGGVVAKGASGVDVQSVKTMDGGRAARVLLEGAQGELLGEENTGGDVLDLVLDKGAAGACAEGLGIAHPSFFLEVASVGVLGSRAENQSTQQADKKPETKNAKRAHQGPHVA